MFGQNTAAYQTIQLLATGILCFGFVGVVIVGAVKGWRIFMAVVAMERFKND